MAKIALVWGLGADLGHITRYSIIAKELIKRGHEPCLILRDIGRMRSILKDQQLFFLQAPVYQQKTKGLSPPLNLTETLFRVGFAEPKALASLLVAWRHLYVTLKPDVIVFDHAPVAQLAALDQPYPTMSLTNTVSMPPVTGPCPRYRYWLNEDGAEKRMAESEARCLEIINQAQQELGLNPVPSLATFLHHGEQVFCERPEFDVYGRRDNCRYIGSINDDSLGALPSWPNSKGRKVFAYLKTRFKHLETLLALLARAETNTIAFVPGLSEKLRKKFTSTSLIFSTEPLQLRALAQQCDYAICHGGTGTVSVFADAGKPMLCIPLQVEQMMFSTRVAETGLAKVFPLGGKNNELKPLFQNFFGDNELITQAAQWASVREVATMDERVSNACDLIEAQI